MAWAIEVLDDLRFAALVQAVASGSIIVYHQLWLRRAPGIPCVDFCIAPLLVPLLLAMLIWSVYSVTLAEMWSRLADATCRVA